MNSPNDATTTITTSTTITATMSDSDYDPDTTAAMSDSDYDSDELKSTMSVAEQDAHVCTVIVPGGHEENRVRLLFRGDITDDLTIEPAPLLHANTMALHQFLYGQIDGPLQTLFGDPLFDRQVLYIIADFMPVRSTWARLPVEIIEIVSDSDEE